VGSKERGSRIRGQKGERFAGSSVCKEIPEDFKAKLRDRGADILFIWSIGPKKRKEAVRCSKGSRTSLSPRNLTVMGTPGPPTRQEPPLNTSRRSTPTKPRRRPSHPRAADSRILPLPTITPGVKRNWAAVSREQRTGLVRE